MYFSFIYFNRGSCVVFYKGLVISSWEGRGLREGEGGGISRFRVRF